MRRISERELVHERLGDNFERALSLYDTQRRLHVLIDDFLGDFDLRGKEVLEVGAGLGYFSERLHQRGATLVATDIGDGLLEKVRSRVGCDCAKVDALALEDYFGRNRFDFVLSSECIEHTPSPNAALQQMARVLRPGGYLSLSTPNLVWAPIVRLATVLGARPFDGLENFSSFASIRRSLSEENVDVLRENGLHILPFHLPVRGFLRWCDDHAQACRSLMINLCVLARKRTEISGR